MTNHPFYNHLNQHLFPYLSQDKSYSTFNTATPRSPSPTLDVQLEIHPESHNIDQATVLRPATTGMQPPSSGRAEPAGIAPTRCLSPSATPGRQELKCCPRGSEVVNQVVGENSSVSLSRRLLQEVKLDDSPQQKVLLTSTTGYGSIYIYFCDRETELRMSCVKVCNTVLRRITL